MLCALLCCQGCQKEDSPSNLFEEEEKPFISTEEPEESEGIQNTEEPSKEPQKSEEPEEQPEESEDPKESEESKEPEMTLEEYSEYRLNNDTVILEEAFNDLIDSSKEIGHCDYSWEDRWNISISWVFAENFELDFIIPYHGADATLYVTSIEDDEYTYFAEVKVKGKYNRPEENQVFDFTDYVALDFTIDGDGKIISGAMHAIDPDEEDSMGDPDETIIDGNWQDEYNSTSDPTVGN